MRARSERATMFGSYPSSAIAASTRTRVAIETGTTSLITFETVDFDTPARSATSRSVGI